MLVRDLMVMLARLPADAVVDMEVNEEYHVSVGSVYSYFDSDRGVDVVVIDDHD